jgi:hypothetical protein
MAHDILEYVILRIMDSATSALEMDKLEKAYSRIADSFSASRATAWPEFGLMASFIDSGDKVLDAEMEDSIQHWRTRKLIIPV